MSESGYLTNQLLIAMPFMGDPNFAQTVALVCDHSSKGALALVLNKPLPMRMGEIFDQLEIKLNRGPLSDRQVLRGGPMQTDRGFVVHRAFGDWDSTLKVSDALHVRPCACLEIYPVDVNPIAARRALRRGVAAHVGVQRAARLLCL